MLRKLLIIGSLVIVSGCSLVTHPTPFGLYRGMRNGAPEGTEIFRAAWKDGCTSGMAAYGSLHYKMVYDYTYNNEMLSNEEYHNAWRLGFRHCRWYTAAWDR